MYEIHHLSMRQVQEKAQVWAHLPGDEIDMALCEYSAHTRHQLCDRKNAFCYCGVYSIPDRLHLIKPESHCEAYLDCGIYKERKLEEAELFRRRW